VNPLIDDRLTDLLFDALDLGGLAELPAFAEHDAGTFRLYVDACRRVGREVLWPSYQATDAEPPTMEDGRVRLHPKTREGFEHVRELGVIAATRPESVGGQQLPLSVATMAHAYLMAGNLSTTGLAWLTTGAGHLIEAFGDDALKATFLGPMMSGRWTGTMALTEPQAGSSLGDLSTTATDAGDGSYRIRGAKIFISGGDHDAAENMVHLVLARIEGAPGGTKGISLFAVPRERPEALGPGAADGPLEPNDVHVAGLIHKIGWRALPSRARSFGDEGDCRGWLVGAPHRGLPQMFQMMNEARIGVGVTAAATASVAYHEALAYARERTQGRALGERGGDPVPIIEHPDVRRMLLRMKAIVDGSLALSVATARYADLASHGPEGERERAHAILDLLTPITKSFPAEYGYEANVLAVQIHGGYGYSSEYVPEALLRDQKLNSIHEGTTQIQALDLLGRKVVAGGGAALGALKEEIDRAIAEAREAGVDEAIVAPLAEGLAQTGTLTMELGAKGAGGDLEGMLGHGVDYLTLFSIVVIGWQHLRLATVARDDSPFHRGLLQSARYWAATELPRVTLLAERCRRDRSYLELDPDWL
jgi:alkylation response protein AidB-like acyl-CoA dehydrogenase